MSDAHPSAESTLETLAGDLRARPPGAPSFRDLAGWVMAVRRDDGQLVVEYRPDSAPEVAALAAAERLCCAGIVWEAIGSTLRVRATAAQLDVLEQVVRLD